MGTKNLKKSAAAKPKRGRGRPSSAQKQIEELTAKLLTAVNFIQTLYGATCEQGAVDAWLENNGYETREQIHARNEAAAAEKRERLEREIAERQAELDKLDGSPGALD